MEFPVKALPSTPPRDSKKAGSVPSSFTDLTMGLKRKASHDETEHRKRQRVDESRKDMLSRLKQLLEEAGGSPPKKKMKTDHNEPTSVHEDSSSTQPVPESSSKGMKRKRSAEEAGPQKKRAPGKEGKKKNVKGSIVGEQRAAFHAKYEELGRLGAGSYGQVFEGRRRADHLPVAIKRIKKKNIYGTQLDDKGKPLATELVIMLKLAGGAAGSAPVVLLDHYYLKNELILVLERPAPCVDLMEYVELHGGSVQEEEAKVIMKQLLAATVELEREGVFHRDIKLDNILIQTGGDALRVRLIDFGMSSLVKPGAVHKAYMGASAYKPPEFQTSREYSAGPTTVWQVGAVLYELVHQGTFDTPLFLSGEIHIRTGLSDGCEDFLRCCLAIVPGQRATLQQLQQHPWLQ
ncbi:serine/threonine-protein kinase pim-1-like [Salarias fasciatus]|uniref:serine/threonine-protein kinase pim-1-like n=1 Tax=Salarias fasciatus TaxID=181472 RepID=UPI001176553C|nr:serine/threonine-protein kinase pim-1-like [Salarias fasciatus]